MKNLTFAKSISVVLLVLSATLNCYPQSKDCYPGAPQQIQDLAKVAATRIVADPARDDERKNDRPGQLGGSIVELLVYTIADAITDIRMLKVAPLMAETARTDKQLGASARAAGSTSAVQKPGFANILGFAIENGAVEQQVNKTSLTLSTSPYMLLLLARGKDGDTAEFYKQNEFFNRIGASANFNLSNPNDPLGSATRRQLNEWSIRVRLLGNRSVRSDQFAKVWDEKVRPLVQRRLRSISDAESKTFNEVEFNSFQDRIQDQMISDLKAQLVNVKGTRDERIAEVRQWILCELFNKVFQPIKRGDRVIDAKTREIIQTKVVMDLKDANESLVALRAAIDNVISEFNKRPLLTFAYGNERVVDGSDYSVYKLLFEQDIWNPMKMVINAAASVYNKPDATRNQEKLRDLSLAISFEGKANSPFLSGTADLSKITYSFNGRYERLKENERIPGKKADIGIAQLKVEIPVREGISIPLSFTWANATELIKENHVRGNFGITFDMDKLFALTRRTTN